MYFEEEEYNIETLTWEIQFHLQLIINKVFMLDSLALISLQQSMWLV